MNKRKQPSTAVFYGIAGISLVGILIWALYSPSQEETAPDSPPPEAPSLPANVSAEEMQQLTELRSQSDPTLALRMAEDGHYQFTGGGLFPDREVIAIRSLVRLGQQEQARERAQRFLRRFPNHPQAEMIRRLAKL